MENIGALAILLAFCLAIYAVTGSVTGKLKRNPFLVVSAERAIYGVWFLVTLASAILLHRIAFWQILSSPSSKARGRSPSPPELWAPCGRSCPARA